MNIVLQSRHYENKEHSAVDTPSIADGVGAKASHPTEASAPPDAANVCPYVVEVRTPRSNTICSSFRLYTPRNKPGHQPTIFYYVRTTVNFESALFLAY